MKGKYLYFEPQIQIRLFGGLIKYWIAINACVLTGVTSRGGRNRHRDITDAQRVIQNYKDLEGL